MLNDHPFQRSDIYCKSDAEIMRRVFDIAVSCLGLIILLPALLLISLVIWVESGRPIFFKQVRLGKNGRPFYMYKFRKFHKDCGTNGSPLTLDKDPRLTIIGSFLVSTKIDEIPQLWNTLRGDMSIVGPRPESLAFADCFIDSFKEVLDHKPGILGPSQVAFRNESSLYPVGTDPSHYYRVAVFPQKARLDLQYYPVRTMRTDLMWIVRGTIAVLSFRSSSYKPHIDHLGPCTSHSSGSHSTVSAAVGEIPTKRG